MNTENNNQVPLNLSHWIQLMKSYKIYLTIQNDRVHYITLHHNANPTEAHFSNISVHHKPFFLISKKP